MPVRPPQRAKNWKLGIQQNSFLKKIVAVIQIVFYIIELKICSFLWIIALTIHILALCVSIQRKLSAKSCKKKKFREKCKRELLCQSFLSKERALHNTTWSAICYLDMYNVAIDQNKLVGVSLAVCTAKICEIAKLVKNSSKVKVHTSMSQVCLLKSEK